MTSIEYKRRVAEEARKYLEERLGNTGSDNHIGEIGENSAASGGRRAAADAEKEDDDRTLFSVTMTVGQGMAEDIGAGKQENSADEKDGNTLDYSSGRKKGYFVTGWLVCTEGRDKGRSYDLYYGYNIIGQNPGSQVCISGDDGNSGNVYGSVVYEERNNCFYLLPEDNARICIGDAGITEPTRMQAGDMLQFGDTKLVFVPFCHGEQKWDKREMREILSGSR